MGFGIDGLKLLLDRIADDSILEKARLSPKNFTRSRKMGARYNILLLEQKRIVHEYGDKQLFW
jgi:hypothetical protein